MKLRQGFDRLLVAAVVLIALFAVVDGLFFRGRPARSFVQAPPRSPAHCRSIDRRLLLLGQRTSDYLKLPCGR